MMNDELHMINYQLSFIKKNKPPDNSIGRFVFNVQKYLSDLLL